MSSSAAPVLKARHDDDRTADVDGAQHRDPGDVGEQSQGAKRHAVAAVAQGDGEIRRPMHAAPVGVNDALGHAGRAGTVDDVAFLVRTDRAGPVRRCGREPPGERRPTGARRPQADAQRRRDRRMSIPQAVDAREVPCGREHHARVRIGDHRRDRIVGDRDVQRHGDAGRAQDAEQQDRHFQAVVHQQDHAVTGLETERAQAVRRARGLPFELRPGQAPLALDERVARRPPFAVQPEQVGQRRLG